MTRSVLVFTCAVTVVAVPADAGQPEPGRRETAREYAHRLYGKRALVTAGVSSAIGQARDVPHEWGQEIGGYAKRVGSALGTHMLKETIQFGVAAWHHEDPHYYRSNLNGTLPRLEYAVKATFIVPRTNEPGKTVAISRLSGAFASGLISRIWQPASRAGIGFGFASGGIMLGADVGVNVAREFWPRKRHRSTKAPSAQPEPRP